MEPRRPPIAGMLRGHRLTDALSWQTENFLFHLLRWWWQSKVAVLSFSQFYAWGVVGRAMLSAFQLFYIPQDMCELVCALSIQPVRAVHLRTHQSVPSGGSSFLYSIFHCALGPKWRVTFHCRGRRRKASVGPSRGSGQRSDSWNFCSLPGCRRRVHHAATLAVKWGPGLIKLHTRSSSSKQRQMENARAARI